MRSRGGPRAADSRPLPRVALSPCPSRRRATTPPPPPVPWRWPRVAAPRRCPSPSVRPPRSARRLLLPGAAPWCVSPPGPAATPIRCPRRRRRRRRVPDEGERPWAPPPPRRCVHPSPGRVPGLAPPRGPVAASSPPGVPRPALGRVDGRTPRARVGRPRGGPGRGSPAPGARGRRRRRRRGPGRGGGGGRGGWPAALLPPSSTPPPRRASRAAAAVAVARRGPRGPGGAWRGRSSSPRAGRGRSGLPARRAPFPRPFSRLPHLAGSLPFPASRHARLPVVLAPLPG